MAKNTFKGSCLCGGVHYEIEAETVESHHCHCQRCRKAHGAAYASWGEVPLGDHRWTQGEGLVIENKHVELARFFCSRCGSPLGGKISTHPGEFYFTLGTLDDEAPLEFKEHIFTAHKAAWHEIADSLPQREEYE